MQKRVEMKTTKIYSIGHGHKTIEEFIKELQSFSVQYLIDVRSSPFSKWATHFNQGSIEHILRNHNIRYVFMGDTIGGRPLDNSYYDGEGFFDYKKMAENPDFLAGLSRLVDAQNKGCIVATMCTETEPSQCHRSKLIGRELFFRHDINMQHIIAPNKTIAETDILINLTNGNWQPFDNLFGSPEPPFFKSRKTYKNELTEEYEYYD